MWGLSSAMVSSRHNKPHSLETEISPPKTKCSCLHGGGHWKRSHTQSSHPMQCTCTCAHVQVWVHIPGYPQSVQLRNATTTTTRCTACTGLRAHVKDPIFICRKRAGSHSRWYGNMKQCTERERVEHKSWVEPYYGCSLSANFSCIALGQESYLI